MVSPEGSVDHAHVISFAGYGLDEIAFNTVRKWKLKPARDKDGAAVGAILNVEMTFPRY
jgi:outer membrane biosynthesis protein TonB